MSIATEGHQKKGSDSKSLKKIIIGLSMIVQIVVNVVLNRTVVVDSDWRFDNLCGSSRIHC